MAAPFGQSVPLLCGLRGSPSMLTILPSTVCTSVPQPTEQYRQTLGVTAAERIRSDWARAIVGRRSVPIAARPPRAVPIPARAPARRKSRRVGGRNRVRASLPGQFFRNGWDNTPATSPTKFSAAEAEAADPAGAAECRAGPRPAEAEAAAVAPRRPAAGRAVRAPSAPDCPWRTCTACRPCHIAAAPSRRTPRHGRRRWRCHRAGRSPRPQRRR
jgi:hypothetical protein